MASIDSYRVALLEGVAVLEERHGLVGGGVFLDTISAISPAPCLSVCYHAPAVMIMD